MKSLFTLASILLFFNLSLSQNKCPKYVSPDVKSIRVVIYTELEECFSIILAGEYLNPQPSSRVEFYMNLGIVKVKAKLEDGSLIEKKIIVSNPKFAEVVFELVKSKKGEYDIKSRLFESSMTESAIKKQEEDLAAEREQQRIKMEEEQKARDKAWEDELNAKKQKREEEKREEERLEQARLDSLNSISNNSTGNANNNSSNSNGNVNNNSNISSDVSTIDSINGKPHTYVFRYKNKAFKNLIIICEDDKGEVLLKGKTDKNGRVTFYTDLYPGVQHDMVFYFMVNGEKKGGLNCSFIFCEYRCPDKVIEFDEFIKELAERLNRSISKVESMYGFDLLP